MTTTAVILGFVAKFAVLRRIRRVVQSWRGGKRIDTLGMASIRKDMGS
jgi:hypothetical protein